MAVQTSTAAPTAASPNQSLAQHASNYFPRLAGGELGALRPALLAAAVTGVVTGLVLGALVPKVRIPSCVVTLAAFLAFKGVALLMLKNGANISVSDPVVNAIENRNLPVWLSWTLLVAVVLGYLSVQLLRVRSRAARGLGTDPLSLIAIRTGGIAVLGGLAVYFLNIERSFNPLRVSLRGVPIVVPLILLLLVVWAFILSRTGYGRHIYAVGGNRGAARRAGINVDRIRISAFVICSGMAAIGGIVAASRANSVDPNTGGSNILLYAVGAAVIGGTSLFRGQGRGLGALLGGAAVGATDNRVGRLGSRAGAKK